jgi:hypothetical protein
MPVPVPDYNAAVVYQASPATDPATYVTTWTVRYLIGLIVSGAFTAYNHPSFQGLAKGTTVVVTCSATDTAQQQYQAVQQAIATQEGLNLAGGDLVVLP